MVVDEATTETLRQLILLSSNKKLLKTLKKQSISFLDCYSPSKGRFNVASYPSATTTSVTNHSIGPRPKTSNIIQSHKYKKKAGETDTKQYISTRCGIDPIVLTLNKTKSPGPIYSPNYKIVRKNNSIGGKFSKEPRSKTPKLNIKKIPIQKPDKKNNKYSYLYTEAGSCFMISTASRSSLLTWHKDFIDIAKPSDREVLISPGQKYNTSKHSDFTRPVSQSGRFGTHERYKTKDTSCYIEFVESPGPVYKPRRLDNLKLRRPKTTMTGGAREIFGGCYEKLSLDASPGPVYLPATPQDFGSVKESLESMSMRDVFAHDAELRHFNSFNSLERESIIGPSPYRYNKRIGGFDDDGSSIITTYTYGTVSTVASLSSIFKPCPSLPDSVTLRTSSYKPNEKLLRSKEDENNMQIASWKHNDSSKRSFNTDNNDETDIIKKMS